MALNHLYQGSVKLYSQLTAVQVLLSMYPNHRLFLRNVRKEEERSSVLNFVEFYDN